MGKHAFTIVRKVPNTRVKDLVDMVLLIRMGGLEPIRLRAALEKTFLRRNTHALPPFLEPPSPTWELPFRELAKECGLDLNLAAGFSLVSDFYGNQVMPLEGNRD